MLQVRCAFLDRRRSRWETVSPKLGVSGIGKSRASHQAIVELDFANIHVSGLTFAEKKGDVELLLCSFIASYVLCAGELRTDSAKLQS